MKNKKQKKVKMEQNAAYKMANDKNTNNMNDMNNMNDIKNMKNMNDMKNMKNKMDNYNSCKDNCNELDY